MRVLGMISGTSHDGIDCAVVDFAYDAVAGVLTGRLLDSASVPYASELRALLVAALPPANIDFRLACELDTRIGQAFAEAAGAAIERAGGADLICSHGQTVFHWVDGAHALGTLQVGQPAWIAELTGIPVVADVRARDVAAGGHGAPLVSLLDTLLLADLPGHPAALNLGGIANMTVLRGPEGPFAYDIGPSNALIDAAVLAISRGEMDRDLDGRMAAAGRVDAALLADLLAEPYYRLPVPRSTGKELFNGAYVDAARARHPDVSDGDLIATLTALTAETVAAEARARGVDTLVASGGGCANPTLMGMLEARADGVRVLRTDAFGAPADTKEAIAFALIGWHTAHGVPAIVPGCTGARAPRILGAIVPGSGPLRLPEPAARPPAQLRLVVGNGHG